MSSNKLKIIACVSMLIDHIGYILFPQVYYLRWIGRIAMPIFAFFIAEGCRHTKHRLKYFLQVFLLGVFCQAVYVANDIITGNFHKLYLNILFTFSFSIILCFAYIDIEKAVLSARVPIKQIFIFGLSFVFTLAFLRFADNVLGFPVSVDYGIRGVLLPLSAVIFKNKHLKMFSFSICLIGFLILFNKGIYTIIFSAFSIPLLYLYDGTYGSKKLKYLFYIFYPTHLAVLHLISLVI
ncbi:MAG: hypothetical protein IIU65_05965 [Clostridia bacterium]|nr:hypothetical protein [Clostridia bacterium]